jgi:hypothetical protein
MADYGFNKKMKEITYMVRILPGILSWKVCFGESHIESHVFAWVRNLKGVLKERPEASE